MKYVLALTLAVLVCGVSLAQAQSVKEAVYARGFAAGFSQGKQNCSIQESQTAKTVVKYSCICDPHGVVGDVIKTDVYSDGSENSHVLRKGVPMKQYSEFSYSCEFYAYYGCE